MPLKLTATSSADPGTYEKTCFTTKALRNLNNEKIGNVGFVKSLKKSDTFLKNTIEATLNKPKTKEIGLWVFYLIHDVLLY